MLGFPLKQGGRESRGQGKVLIGTGEKKDDKVESRGTEVG